MHNDCSHFEVLPTQCTSLHKTVDMIVLKAFWGYSRCMFVKPCMESTTNLQLWSSGERTNVYQTELAFHNRITDKYHAVHMQNAIQGQSFSEQFNR